MNKIIFTVDLDWACEAAIEDTLCFLFNYNIFPTVFITHKSPFIESNMHKMEIGLHPYFAPDSSHGATIDEVVKHIMDLPHNFPAFRCHRFATCNTSKQALIQAGMKLSSNVCTDLEIVKPFKDRFGLLEVPIFMEDGGYLWRKYTLTLEQSMISRLLSEGLKVILIHPMHFTLNTPHFSYMCDIKQSVNRTEWINMTSSTLKKLRWPQRGIRDLLIDIIGISSNFSTLGTLLNNS